jgi:hypothetical protein
MSLCLTALVSRRCNAMRMLLVLLSPATPRVVDGVTPYRPVLNLTASRRGLADFGCCPTTQQPRRVHPWSRDAWNGV